MKRKKGKRNRGKSKRESSKPTNEWSNEPWPILKARKLDSDPQCQWCRIKHGAYVRRLDEMRYGYENLVTLCYDCNENYQSGVVQNNRGSLAGRKRQHA